MTAISPWALRQQTHVMPWEPLARLRIFWIGTTVIIAMAILTVRSFDDMPGFLLIALTALLPAFLWCRRAAHGIPIYPVFALGTLGTFGFPLITQLPVVMEYSPAERLAAAATIAMANLAGCAFWFLFTRHVSPPPSSYWGFRLGSGDAIFFAAILTDTAFNIVTSSIDLKLDPAVFSIVRAVIQALAKLAIFVLAYRAGQRRFSANRSRFYLIVVVALLVSNLPSVLMVNALSLGGLALMGFALGRGSLPGVALVGFFGLALFLQAGKSAIREKYWSEAEGAPISFTHFPEFLGDWIGFSWHQIFVSHSEGPLPNSGDEAAAPQSLPERASLLHLFLRIQKMSPAETPYLHGATYTIIPRLLVPRLFDEGKARAHLGTYLLAIHYDLQRPEDTSFTTIGFGLINEAMANFGRTGCVALGALLGSFYGWAGRWSASYPLLSLRALLSILILTVAFENEFTAGVYVTTLFQGTCALLLFSAATMRRVTVPCVNHSWGWTAIAIQRAPQAAVIATS